MIFNIGSGAPSGETLVVTAPAGVTVTASKDTKTKTKVAGANGLVTFKGLSAGTWTVSITDGAQTSSKTIAIVTGYSMTIGFFSATITATYPAGSTCTCSDGMTTITATDTTGSYTFTVPNAGTWTVTSTDGTNTKSTTIEITTEGQNGSVNLSYALYLFNGTEDCSGVTGGWTAYNKTSCAHIGTVSPTVATTDGVLKVTMPKATKAGESGAVATTNAIDMSGYTKLCVNVTEVNASSSIGHFYLGVTPEITSGYDFSVGSEKLTATGLYEFDISTLSEGTYVFAINVCSMQNYAASVTIDSIYLQ